MLLCMQAKIEKQHTCAVLTFIWEHIVIVGLSLKAHLETVFSFDFAKPAKRRRPIKRDYSPTPWNQFFEKSQKVQVDNENIFNVYQRGSSGPLCVCLHGGGFSGLSWALLAKSLTDIVQCQCLAIDLCGHGETQTTDETDFSLDRQAKDVSAVLHKLYADNPPPIVLIGHSMGGAVAVHTAHLQLVPSLVAVTVIDVVEGTALDALSGMQSVLRGRPTQFKSLEYAIEWCCRTGYIHNMESAKVSMIGQLKYKQTNEAATCSDTNQSGDSSASCAPGHEPIREESEEGDEEDDQQQNNDQQEQADDDGDGNEEEADATQMPPPSDVLAWRIDLFKTQPFWREWFEGLSAKFLSISAPKLLLLAGIDRLDKDLTVGQMQGKFQMQILPRSGHAVHEDAPDKVAEVIGTFLLRNRFAEASAEFEKVYPAC